jgi:galactokinase
MTFENIQSVESIFERHFCAPPACVVHVPGRLELLGNHTDYNDGLVMALAVDKFVYIAASPRSDGKAEIFTSAFQESEVFRVDDIGKNPARPWANYVKGVLDQLRKRNVPFGGFTAAIHSTIPLGVGMSSSAALEIATALTLRQLYPFRLSEAGVAAAPPARNENGGLPPIGIFERMQFAKLCRAAENEFVGVQCGILDQISSLYGRAWSVVGIDCRSLVVDYEPLPKEAIVVCHSGVKHELVNGEYNELRRNCESAAKKLDAPSLRTVDAAQVESNQAGLTPREFECARHVVTEIDRVRAGARALHANNYRQFGQYMFESHESSRKFLRNSTRELDTLVDLARQHPGCLGARLTGGGFGGATINLVARQQADEFVDYMSRKYLNATGIVLTPILCQVVDGAAREPGA